MTEISQPTQTNLSDILSIEWEIPQLPQSIEGQNPDEYISPDLVNTLREGRVESGLFGDEINRIYGRTGIMIHNAVLDLLRNRDAVYVSDRLKLIYYRDSMECVFERLDPESVENLKSTLAWVCLLLRCPVDNELCISQGRWSHNKFTLHPLRPVDWRQSCFKKLFIHGIVATFEESIPQRPVLSAPMPIIFLLTGVNYAVPVGEGIIFHGVFSAMIPMRKLPGGSILVACGERPDPKLHPTCIPTRGPKKTMVSDEGRKFLAAKSRSAWVVCRRYLSLRHYVSASDDLVGTDKYTSLGAYSN